MAYRHFVARPKVDTDCLILDFQLFGEVLPDVPYGNSHATRLNPPGTLPGNRQLRFAPVPHFGNTQTLMRLLNEIGVGFAGGHWRCTGNTKKRTARPRQV